MGNPLLDMQLTGEAAHEMLTKYALKPNDAVLAEGKQNEIYEDLRKNYKVTYVAGGAAQNCARGAQYVLPNNSTAYLGAVGKDDLADQLRAANEKEGLASYYQVVEDKPTGACAVIITGHDRSLCTTLGAAESFSPSHLDTPKVKSLIDNAKFFYLGGFFLTHGLESALKLAKLAVQNDKPFTMNLSAPFIPQFFKSQLDQILPYVSILIGNEAEAESYALSHDWENPKEIKSVALKLSQIESKTNKKGRIVVITQGSEQTIVAKEGKIQLFNVAKLDESKIVDTNGAGDAFAGGFLGAYASGKSLEESIEVGHRLGVMNVQLIGPTFKFPKEKVM
ncbi:BQ5605_C026g10122 [Microbotryum silenes-dioicae]|uniref:Adenosine kinase n=1 Tax=Microbotryum silenes-dioicae TaxID=796604 RepID=A0A2X0PMS6_9BASI|nr:BQ5605_C026g10122 [Microbotryum silenes-dioicae]